MQNAKKDDRILYTEFYHPIFDKFFAFKSNEEIEIIKILNAVVTNYKKYSDQHNDINTLNGEKK